MKTLRSFCAAATLILVLSLPTMAGDMTTWGVAPPPPPPSASAIDTEPGDITIWGIQSSSESEPLLSEVTLSILQLLPVF